MDRCPRKLKSPPCESCPMGLESVKAIRDARPPLCEWFINDAESHYCFWAYMAANKNTPTADDKIARLLMISDSDVKRTIQSFKKKASKMPEFRED